MIIQIQQASVWSIFGTVQRNLISLSFRPWFKLITAWGRAGTDTGIYDARVTYTFPPSWKGVVCSVILKASLSASFFCPCLNKCTSWPQQLDTVRQHVILRGRGKSPLLSSSRHKPAPCDTPPDRLQCPSSAPGTDPRLQHTGDGDTGAVGEQSAADSIFQPGSNLADLHIMLKSLIKFQRARDVKSWSLLCWWEQARCTAQGAEFR